MQSQQKKILVLEDDVDILDFLQVLFTQEGYAVTVTERAEYAEALPHDSLPDLILIDISLSGRDGRDIVRRLKSQPQTGSIPMIIFSAHMDAERSARAAGADDFVAKPFDIDELLEKIARLL